MMTITPGETLSPKIPSQVAWEALNHMFRIACWNLKIAHLRPITIEVDHSPHFAEALSGALSASSLAQALAWVAQRVVDASRSLTRAQLRKLNLQIPESSAGPSADVFLDGLKRRVEFAIRAELTAYFDQSIAEWERDALDYVARCRDPLERERFWTYSGLDQLVSDDAARKAVKFLIHRTGWNLQGDPDDPDLVTDWRFTMFLTRRNSDDEMLRARSLVARAVEQIFADNSRRRMEGQRIAPITRFAIVDIIQKRFSQDGAWGLVHLVLDSDRGRYGLEKPTDPDALALLELQQARLFRVWCPERGDR